MARTVQGPDRVASAHLFTSFSGKRIWVVSLGLTVILGIIGVISTHAGTRDWIWSSLGYGFIPVGLWVVTFGLALRCKRTLISHFGFRVRIIVFLFICNVENPKPIRRRYGLL